MFPVAPVYLSSPTHHDPRGRKPESLRRRASKRGDDFEHLDNNDDNRPCSSDGSRSYTSALASHWGRDYLGLAGDCWDHRDFRRSGSHCAIVRSERFRLRYRSRLPVRVVGIRPGHYHPHPRSHHPRCRRRPLAAPLVGACARSHRPGDQHHLGRTQLGSDPQLHGSNPIRTGSFGDRFHLSPGGLGSFPRLRDFEWYPLVALG